MLMTEMLANATGFVQGGYTEEESAQLAKLAAMYQNVADGQVSAADATGLIISQLKAFKIETKDAIQVLDIINKISNEFAVSSSDLSNGLRANSASLASYNNTMSESAALITGATEIMTGKATQVSNGLKSIGAEIVKLANSSGKLEFSVNGVTKSVSLLDEQTGDLKSTFQVLSEVNESWDEMSKAEQSALGLMLGKKNQTSVLLSLMGNYETAIKANQAALESQGSAMEENARQADSIKSKLNAVKTEIESIVLGSGGLEKFIKSTLNATIALLKFADTTGLVKVALLDIAVILAGTFLPKILNFSKLILVAATSTGTLSARLQLLGIQATAAQLALGGLVGVLSIGLMALNAWSAAQEKARQQARQNAEDLTNQAKSINDVIDKLKDENTSRKDLISAIESTNSKYTDELSAIKDINELRSKGIELLQEEAKEKIRAAQAAIASDVTTAQRATRRSTSILGDRDLSPYLGDSTRQASTTGRGTESRYNFDNLKAQTEALQKATEEARKNVEAGTEQQSVLDKLNKLYNESKEKLDGYNATLKQDAEYTNALIDPNSLLGRILQDVKDSFIQLAGGASEAGNALEDYFYDLNDDEIKDLAKSLKMSTEEFENNAIAMGLSLAEYGEYATASKQIQKLTEDTNSSIDGLQSALGIATNALAEYNKYGSLSLDTFQSFVSLSADQLTALVNQDNQLSINQETLGNLVEQLKVAKIEELQNAAAADILALAHGNVDEMSNTAKEAIKGFGDNISKSGDEASTATGKMLGFATSVLAVVNASKGLEGGSLPDDFEAKQQAIIDGYTKVGNEISKITVDTTRNVATGLNKDSKAAKKGAKDRTDAYKEEYDKQLKDLDHSLAMNLISEKEYYNKLQELNEKYFGIASGQHQKYLDEYRKNQEKIYQWQKKQEEDLYKNATTFIKDSLKKKSDLLKKDKENELNDIKEEIDEVKKREEREIKRIDKRLKSIKKEKDEFNDSMKTQIDAISKLQDKEDEEWKAKIDAYKEANKLLQEQIDLQKLQEALANAKSKRVSIFKDGQFTYGQDEAGISQAQQAIEDYYTDLKQQRELEALEKAKDAAHNNYQQQIDALKAYKDEMSNQYDEEIKRLEEHKEELQEYYDARIEQMEEFRDEVEADYDERIKMMDNYIENFETMVSEYDNEQNRMALIQLKGADAEKEVWMMRLENLRDFVNDYNRLQDELDNGSTNNTVEADFKSSSSISGTRASGDSSIKEDGAYIVGGEKHKEIILGSKLNNGVPVNLSQGSGVVNAKSTNTLAGILNSLPNTLFGSPKETINNSSSNSMIIDKLYVQADNAMDFIDSMTQQFRINTKQEAFSR